MTTLTKVCISHPNTTSTACIHRIMRPEKKLDVDAKNGERENRILIHFHIFLWSACTPSMARNHGKDERTPVTLGNCCEILLGWNSNKFDRFPLHFHINLVFGKCDMFRLRSNSALCTTWTGEILFWERKCDLRQEWITFPFVDFG